MEYRLQPLLVLYRCIQVYKTFYMLTEFQMWNAALPPSMRNKNGLCYTYPLKSWNEFILHVEEFLQFQFKKLGSFFRKVAFLQHFQAFLLVMIELQTGQAQNFFARCSTHHYFLKSPVDKWRSDSTMQFHYICRQELFRFSEKMSKRICCCVVLLIAAS